MKAVHPRRNVAQLDRPFAVGEDRILELNQSKVAVGVVAHVRLLLAATAQISIEVFVHVAQVFLLIILESLQLGLEGRLSKDLAHHVGGPHVPLNRDQVQAEVDLLLPAGRKKPLHLIVLVGLESRQRLRYSGLLLMDGGVPHFAVHASNHGPVMPVL